MKTRRFMLSYVETDWAQPRFGSLLVVTETPVETLSVEEINRHCHSIGRRSGSAGIVPLSLIPLSTSCMHEKEVVRAGRTLRISGGIAAASFYTAALVGLHVWLIVVGVLAMGAAAGSWAWISFFARSDRLA